MAFEAVTAAHRLAYKENVQLAVQQKRSRFENYFTYQGNLTGRQMRVLELIGTTEARVDAERGGDTPHIEARIEDVWLRPRRLDWGRLIEKEDTIKAAIDYSSVSVQDGAAAIARGRDRSFMGITFVRWQGLPTVTGQPTQRRIPLWTKSGMHYGPFSDLETQIERNANKNYRLHPYMEIWCGATRSEDAKVVEIICSEA